MRVGIRAIVSSRAASLYREIFRLIALSAVVWCAGCAPRSLEDMLGVKPRNLTPEQFAALNQPGASHEVLTTFVGEWNVDVLSRSSPDANPKRSSARSSASWVLGYRYVREKYKSLEMGPRYEGLGYLGYDAGAQVYSSVWMDSFNTSIATSRGVFNPETETFALKGEIYDPLLGRMKETRTLIQILSTDSYKITMVDRTARGKDFISLELTYNRIPN
ncbi:MAG: hypothetical protein RIS36_2241 [Pseudomonadota bacterium]